MAHIYFQISKGETVLKFSIQIFFKKAFLFCILIICACPVSRGSSTLSRDLGFRASDLEFSLLGLLYAREVRLLLPRLQMTTIRTSLCSKVQREFMWMRPDMDFLKFFCFYLNPSLDEVLGKDISLQKETMVRFQGVYCLINICW